MTAITILGLGEAGRLYARGLRDAGADVRGYDPHHELGDPAIAQFEHLSDALAGTDLVLSLVTAAAAASAARDALPLMPATAVYADLNTAAPELKRQIDRLAIERAVRMADVGVLAPVPRAGHRTHLVASGSGATELAGILVPLGVPVDVIGAPAGEAARLRLLRSVFMKGLAALIIEGIDAAGAVGAEPWLRDQIAGELGPDGAALVDRLISGTYTHAARREHEVRDALDVLETAGQPADMTRATLATLRRIVAAQSG